MGFQNFTSALASTAPKLVTAKKFIYNIVSENNFETLFWMLAGRKMSDILRGGSEIRARVKFESGSQADNYDIGTTTFTPGVSQDGANVTSYWHGHMAYDGYYEEVVDINSGGTGEGDTIDETWTQEIFNMMQSLYTALHKSLALGFWRVPDPSNMGQQGYKYQNSIPAILNDHLGAPATHGAATSLLSTTRLGLFNTGTAQWRTIHGVDVIAQQKFAPKVQMYGTGDTGFDPNVITNVVFALDMAVRKTTFKPPPVSRDYFDKEEETAIDKSGGVIFTSAKGVSGLEQVYRSSQDRWTDWMDPFGQPKFKGIPVVFESLLDTQQLYQVSTTSTATEDLATLKGPRYWGVNAKRYRAYFKSNRFMKMLKPVNSRENPTYWTQYCNSLMSTLCIDRSKNFIVSPVATQTRIVAL